MCAGGKCLRALHDKEGAFSIYQGTEVDIVGFTTCGGCPGGNIEYAPERGNLFTFMNVKENLSVGAYLMRDKMDENFASVHEMLPLLKERQKQQAGTLSGGERQMLSLGRAWMTGPRLLLLDEPTLGLAPIVIAKIADTIEDLKKKGATIIIAEQNVSFTSAHARGSTSWREAN